MVKAALFAAAGFFLLCAGLPANHPPELQSMGRIQDGDKDLQVDEYSVPTTADWNNDGRKDLVVGQYFQGNVLTFMNQGTDLNPAFAGGKKVYAGGQPITTTFT